MGIFEIRESKRTELKRTIPEKGQLVKTCVAFSNGQGGEIVLGVENSTNEIIGISDKIRDQIFEEFPSIIMNAVVPHIVPEIFERNVDEKRIVIIKIYPGSRPPYFVAKEGVKRGVYLRVGLTTRRATEEYIEDLCRQQKKNYFDEDLSELRFSDLDKDLVSEIYGKKINDEQKIMEKIGTRSPRDPQVVFATNAAILFFHSNPEIYIPESIVICTEFKGIKGREIIRTLDLKGPIPSLVEQVLRVLSNWLERNLRVSKSGKLEGEHIIPLVAIREALINALIHRKYFIPGAVKIALFENRLEIFSPGGLPGLMSLENLGDGTTFLRNPTIAKIARKYKLIEKLGSGIKLIFESCKNAGIRRPLFNEDGDFFKVIFLFEPDLSENLEDEEKIIKIGKVLEKVRIQDLVEQIGFSRNTATRKMNNLIKKKIFQRRGRGPGVYYLYCTDKVVNGKS